MSQILGTVVAAQVTTGDTANTFPIGDQNEMLGGNHSVITLADRDAIPNERRQEGMTCYVSITQQIFRLIGGTDNSNWVEESAADAFQVASQAYLLATSGTAGVSQVLSLAGSGTDTANAALALAQSAVNGVSQVYPIATTGTDLANLAITWIGTINVGATDNVARAEAESALAGVNQLYPIAAYGTNLAYVALQTAWAGTIIPPLASLPDVSVPTPLAQQVLTYDGSKWVATDGPTATAPFAFTYYLDQAPSGTDSYDSLITSPSGAPEEITQATVMAAGGPAYFAGFISSSVDRTILDPGIWEFNTFASVDYGTNSARMITDIYKRDIDGNETYLFSGTSPSFNSVTEPDLLDYQITQSSFVTVLTDKLVAKYWAVTSSPSVVVSFYHCGTSHDSHLHTPLRTAHNDLAGLQGGQLEQYYHLTQDQWNALVGTSGSPSASNPFVTSQDSRLSDATSALAGVNQVYSIATAGTNLAASAAAGVGQVYSIANSGTAGVNQVFPIAVTGTNLASLAITWIGTLNSSSGAVDSVARASAASAAAGVSQVYSIANAGTAGVNQVFPIATAGTTVANLCVAWIGTLNTSSSNVDTVARTVAYSGTAGVNQVYSIANSGTAGVNQVFPIAVAGTAVANLCATWIGTLNSNPGGSGVDQTARNVAYSGTSGVNQVFPIANAGTAGVNQVLPIAVAGTNLAYTALTTAWTGTSLAYTALTTAWLGTTQTNISSTGSTLATTGNITLDFARQHFQIINMSGDGTLATANRSMGASVTAVIYSNGGGRNIYFPATWMWLNTSPTTPINLATGKNAVLSLTAFGTSENNIFAVYAATP